MILGILYIAISFIPGTLFFYKGVERIATTGNLIPENPFVPKEHYEILWKLTGFYSVPLLKLYSVVNPKYSFNSKIQEALKEAEEE